MPIEIYTAPPGQGKSVKLALKGLELLKRNVNYYKKTGKIRKVVSNLTFSPQITDKYKEFIAYWSDLKELTNYSHVDILWDEIATELDSTRYKDLSLVVKRFLQQHRKLGIEIYGTTQDFAMVDVAMRRMTSNLYYMRKLFGSRDLSATKPPPRWIFGLIMIRELDPRDYDEKEKKFVDIIPDFIIMDKETVSIFDTNQQILPGSNPDLEHSTRQCKICGKTITYHQ